MILSDEFHALAVEMLTEDGAPATITPVLPQSAPTSDQKFNRAARTPSSVEAPSQTRVVLRDEDVLNDEGRLVRRTVATVLDEPAQGGKLTVGAITYKVDAVQRIAPQGQTIFWKAVLS